MLVKTWRKTMYVLFIACLLGGLVGCVPKAPTTPEPEPTHSQPVPIQGEETGTSSEEQAAGGELEPPDPIAVQVDLDTADSIQVYVPVEGGQITLSLANGLGFELVIPKDALAFSQIITLTPIRRMGDLPLSGGMVAGLKLEPDGLYLAEPAILTITIPASLDVAEGQQLVGFAYSGNGERFHLAPWQVNGQTLRLEINTFSGHGAAVGTPAEAQGIAGRRTGDSAADIEQAVAYPTPTGGESGEDYAKRMIPFLAREYTQNIRKQLQAAEKNEKLCDSAVLAFLMWQKSVELLSLEKVSPFDQLIPEGTGRAVRAIKYAFDKSAEKCVSEPDLDQMGEMITRLKQIALLSDDPEYTLDNKQDLFFRCMVFDAEFRSELEYDENGIKVSVVVEGRGTLKPADFGIGGEAKSLGWVIPLRGEGSMETVSYSIDFNDGKGACDAKIDGPTGKVYWAGFYDPRQGWGPPAHIVDMLGFTFTGMQQKVSDIVCGDGMHQTSWPAVVQTPFWAAGFSTLHGKEFFEYTPLHPPDAGAKSGIAIDYFLQKPKNYDDMAYTAYFDKKYVGQRWAKGFIDTFKLYIWHTPQGVE